MLTTDILIVGQGLAGSALAWRLAERGVAFTVVDRGGPSASRVAAGLVTPITGRRLTLSPDWASMRRVAETFYRGVEQQTGARLFHPRPALRLFASPAERDLFEQRRCVPEYADQVAPLSPNELPSGLLAEYGGFWMSAAARLDVAGFLRATQAWLVAQGAFYNESLSLADDFHWDATGVSLHRLGLRAKRLVFCLGADEPPPPRGVGDQLMPAKGELLCVAAPKLLAPCVVHRGIWIAPDGDGTAQRYLVGATHEWRQLNTEPTVAARDELLAGVATMHHGSVKVIDQAAAIRPAGINRQPIARVSNAKPCIAWLNGLGAKGALWAPWHAGQLANQLTFGAAR